MRRCTRPLLACVYKGKEKQGGTGDLASPVIHVLTHDFYSKTCQRKSVPFYIQNVSKSHCSSKGSLLRSFSDCLIQHVRHKQTFNFRPWFTITSLMFSKPYAKSLCTISRWDAKYVSKTQKLAVGKNRNIITTYNVPCILQPPVHQKHIYTLIET